MSKKDDMTVELSSGGKTTGPMSMKEFRELPKKLRAITKDIDKHTAEHEALRAEMGVGKRLVYGTADGGDYFIEFPLKEDFEERACEYIPSGPDWALAARIGEELCRVKRQDLHRVRIGYLWKRAGGARNGKAVLGKAVKANPLVRTFTDRLGFVVLSADHVQRFKLTRWQIEALIFHELAHFRFEDGTLNTYGHDFEAFKSEVEEYGLWKPDLRLANEAFKQIELPGVAAK